MDVVCVYRCVYVHVHICDVRGCVYAHASVCVGMYVSIHVCTFVFLCVHFHVSVCGEHLRQALVVTAIPNLDGVVSAQVRGDMRGFIPRAVDSP